MSNDEYIFRKAATITIAAMIILNVVFIIALATLPR